jgi:hypothetical protein
LAARIIDAAAIAAIVQAGMLTTAAATLFMEVHL